jgi:hypothetical protein
VGGKTAKFIIVYAVVQVKLLFAVTCSRFFSLSRYSYLHPLSPRAPRASVDLFDLVYLASIFAFPCSPSSFLRLPAVVDVAGLSVSPTMTTNVVLSSFFSFLSFCHVFFPLTVFFSRLTQLPLAGCLHPCLFAWFRLASLIYLETTEPGFLTPCLAYLGPLAYAWTCFALVVLSRPFSLSAHSLV